MSIDFLKMNKKISSNLTSQELKYNQEITVGYKPNKTGIYTIMNSIKGCKL